MTEKLIRDVLMLWATIDPIGTLSIFVGVTAGLSAQQRRQVARKACLYSFAILLAAIVIGQLLLSGMGIQLLSLQVAGGIILFLFGLKMVFGRMPTSSGGPEEDHDVAVFPLAVPSIAGPGGILAVIVLTDNNLHPISVQIGTTAVMAGILLLTYLLMRAADRILAVIGRNGAAILVCVMGMIVAALSAELVLEALGVAGWRTGEGAAGG